MLKAGAALGALLLLLWSLSIGLPSAVFTLDGQVVAGTLAGGAVLVILAALLPRADKLAGRRHRGSRLLCEEEFVRRARARLPSDDPGVFFAGLDTPTSESVLGYCAFGGTGSGKTVSLRLTMQSVLPRIIERPDWRAVVMDAKGDMLQILRGMNLECPIHVINPFDLRSVEWDIAKDIDTRARAAALASILIPVDRFARQKFFEQAARSLLKWVVITLMETSGAGRSWRMADVMYILRDDDRLKRFLSRTAEGRERVNRYFGRESTAHDIMSTITNSIEEYEIIAAMWSRSRRSLSLRDFVRGQSILVLCDSEEVRPAIQALNRVIFQRLVQMLLRQPDSADRRTWVFIDELAKAGGEEPLPMLDELIVKGRSKGVSPYLCSQSLEGVIDRYGSSKTSEMLEQLQHWAILRCGGKTAHFGSRLLGDCETSVVSPGPRRPSKLGRSVMAADPHGQSPIVTDLQVRPVVMPEEIANLPITNLQNGLPGYYVLPDVGATHRLLPGEELFVQRLKPISEKVKALRERPPRHQRAADWHAGDLERLKLPADFENSLATSPLGRRGSRRRPNVYRLIRSKEGDICGIEKDETAEPKDDETSS